MTINLYALQFAPGEPVYLEIIPKRRKNVTGYSFLFHQKKILLSQHGWGMRGFFALSPYLNDEIESSKEYLLEVEPPSHLPNHRQSYPVEVSRIEFPTSKTVMDVGKFSSTQKKTPEELEHIEESRRLKTEVYETISRNKIDNRVSHPRDYHFITSPFWSIRIYARYKQINGKKIFQEPRTSIHRGLDFRAPEGAPIYSIASGKVALARELYYEGNSVFIDHGNAIFSVYSHMSRLDVKTGDYIRAGRQIGLAGQTGQATGPHLHLALFIDGVPVNPLSFLSLPIRH